ncbi:MAG: hypothetical protein L0Y54_15210 [Sporichthyaceae bacterium]|nr:hypothetical protein [Sporichthyaceae bacterium]
MTRSIEVAPERLAGWCAGFGERHGGVLVTEPGPDRWLLRGADGAVAELEPPFPPVRVGPAEPAGQPERPEPVPELAVDPLVAHVCAERTVGVLLVRLGAHAAGIFDGTRLVASKVDRTLVHGRHKAGGSSQQRFARRREGQAKAALDEAADLAARLLLPALDRLDAVVLGGDRRAVSQLRPDRRLGPLFALATQRFLTVPEPRLVVLADTPRLFRAVRIQIREPDAAR